MFRTSVFRGLTFMAGTAVLMTVGGYAGDHAGGGSVTRGGSADAGTPSKPSTGAVGVTVTLPARLAGRGPLRPDLEDG